MAKQKRGCQLKKEVVRIGSFEISKEKYRGSAFNDKFKYVIFKDGAYVITCRTIDDAERVVSYLKPSVSPTHQKE